MKVFIFMVLAFWSVMLPLTGGWRLYSKPDFEEYLTWFFCLGIHFITLVATVFQAIEVFK